MSSRASGASGTEAEHGYGPQLTRRFHDSIRTRPKNAHNVGEEPRAHRGPWFCFVSARLSQLLQSQSPWRAPQRQYRVSTDLARARARARLEFKVQRCSQAGGELGQAKRLRDAGCHGDSGIGMGNDVSCHRLLPLICIPPPHSYRAILTCYVTALHDATAGAPIVGVGIVSRICGLTAERGKEIMGRGTGSR